MNEIDIPTRTIENYSGKVTALERELLKYEQVQMTPVHHFAEGLYARELMIPAGTIIVGQVHHFEHINFLMQGDITVFTDDGVKRLQAPAIIKSKAGIKRAAVTHSDTIWVTVHATDEIEGCDMVKLESKLCSPTIADYDGYLLEQINKMIAGGKV